MQEWLKVHDQSTSYKKGVDLNGLVKVMLPIQVLVVPLLVQWKGMQPKKRKREKFKREESGNVNHD
jgi:hypothetical protein